MPSLMAPARASSSSCLSPASGTRLLGSLRSASSPGTFSTKNSFSTPSAAATSAATVSALVLSTWPSGVALNGAITGT